MVFKHDKVIATSNIRSFELLKSKFIKRKENMIYPPQRAKSFSPKLYDLVIEYYTLKVIDDPTKNHNINYNLDTYKKRLASVVLEIVKECESVDNAEKIIQDAINEYQTVFSGTDKEKWISLLEHLKQSVRRRVLGTI